MNRPANATDALARGAARATGERARRTRTPLLMPEPGAVATEHAVDAPAVVDTPDETNGMAALPAERILGGADGARELVSRAARRAATAPRRATEIPADVPAAPAAGAPLRKVPARHRPQPAPLTDPAPAGAPPGRARRAPDEQRHTADISTPPGPTDLAANHTGAQHVSMTAGVDLAEMLELAIAMLRSLGAAAGLAPDEVEAQVAATLAFVRRRVAGEYEVDTFGFDQDFTENVYLPLLRPLYKRWFRVEVRGMEHLPASGGALLVANHSGTVALDSLMTQVAVHDEHPAKRHLRMLGADLVFEMPLVGEVARKSGSTLATQADAERLLSSGELVGVWPEGFKGIGKPFSERYRLQRFGRGGFVSAAIRTGVPIIPCSIVGAEEIYPIIGNMKTFARLLGVPYAPVTPTWPLLGPLGLIPLPSKWLIEFGEPLETAHLGMAAADDPMLVFDLTDRIRETIQQTLHGLLRRRRSAFF